MTETAKQIPLVNRRREVVAWTSVDDGDYAELSRFSWFLRPNGYAARIEVRGGKQVLTYMHRQLLGLGVGQGSIYGDHLNHDRLDNRRVNLRVVNPLLNAQNQRAHKDSTSRYRGVSYQSRDHKWKAAVSISGVDLCLGYFKDEQVAADIAAVVQRALLRLPEAALETLLAPHREGA